MKILRARKWYVRKLVRSTRIAEQEFMAARDRVNGDFNELVFARALLVRDRHGLIERLPLVERIYAWWLMKFGDARL